MQHTVRVLMCASKRGFVCLRRRHCPALLVCRTSKDGAIPGTPQKRTAFVGRGETGEQLSFDPDGSKRIMLPVFRRLPGIACLQDK